MSAARRARPVVVERTGSRGALRRQARGASVPRLSAASRPLGQHFEEAYCVSDRLLRIVSGNRMAPAPAQKLRGSADEIVRRYILIFQDVVRRRAVAPEPPVERLGVSPMPSDYMGDWCSGASVAEVAGVGLASTADRSLGS